MPIIVQKYGGTSVDGRERLMAVATRVAGLRGEGFDVVVVVSARGETTDALLEEARSIAAEPAQRELDMLMTAGERISMSLLAIALNSLGCPAVSFTGSQVGIITDTRHTNARILEVRPHRVVDELEKGNVVVVGGFQGVSTEKDVTTLGRGGSDTTAVALAAALGAERCEILTDVDAVHTADPATVRGARAIDEISYEDMAELARHGATVLKEEAVLFARRSGIAVHVANSHGSARGTIVLESPRSDEPIAGLSMTRELLALRAPGLSLSGLSEELARPGVEVQMLTSAGPEARAVVKLGRGRIGDWPAGIETEPAAVVCVVGREAGKAETAAAAAAVLASLSCTLIASSSGGRSTLLAVPAGRAEEALAALHTRFFGAFDD